MYNEFCRDSWDTYRYDESLCVQKGYILVEIDIVVSDEKTICGLKMAIQT